jgi:hypothetical protein
METSFTEDPNKARPANLPAWMDYALSIESWYPRMLMLQDLLGQNRIRSSVQYPFSTPGREQPSSLFSGAAN